MIVDTDPVSPISFGRVSLTRTKRKTIDILVVTAPGEGGTYTVEVLSSGPEFAAVSVNGTGTNVSGQLAFPDAAPATPIPATVAFIAPAFPGPVSATLTINIRNTGGAIVDFGTATVQADSVVPALVLVLDRSGSMALPVSSDTRANRLRAAASKCLDLMLDHEKLGVVIFGDEAVGTLALRPLATPDVLFDGVPYATQRAAAEALLGLTPEYPALDPRGGTAISKGISSAQAMLIGEVDQKILTFTDGHQDAASLPPVPSPDAYAVGVGEYQDVSTPTLASLTGGNSNYVLVNGSATGSWNVRLASYFANILVDVKNYEIVVDSQAPLTDGVTQIVGAVCSESPEAATLRRLVEDAIVRLTEIRDEFLRCGEARRGERTGIGEA